MRLSIAVCLLIVVISASYSAGKKKESPKQNTKPEPAKNKANTKKQIKKEETEEEEEETDEEYETEEDEDDGDVSEQDHESDDEEESDQEESDEEDSDEEGSDEETSSEEENDGEKEIDNVTYFQSEEFKGELREQIEEKGIYYSAESLKKYFSSSDFKGFKDIETLLQKYNASEYQIKEKLEAKEGKHMYPFYVVEGVNPATRRKVAQILAHRVKGLWILNQPRISLGPVLKDDLSKKAYYSFSKYMIAHKVQNSLFSKPIVTESYWTEHAAFIMAKVWGTASKLPKPGAEVYKFPEDLLVPNVTFAIFNTPPPRLGKKTSKAYLFEQRMLLIYKRFTGAKIHIIRHPESAKQIADKIDMYLHGLGNRLHQERKFNIEVIE